MNQDQFLLDSGFWGWLYKLLYPVEWLMTQIMAGFHRFMVMLGMNEIGFSWVMSIVFLVIVVQACVFPLFYKSMKGMRKMQAQMAVLQPKMQRIQKQVQGQERSRQQRGFATRDDEALPGQRREPDGRLHVDAAYVRAGSCVHVHVLHPVGHSIHRPWQVQERFRPRRLRHRHRQAVHLHQRVRRERGRELHHRRHPRQDHHRHLRGVDVLLPVAHAVQQHEAQHGPERCEQAD